MLGHHAYLCRVNNLPTDVMSVLPTEFLLCEHELLIVDNLGISDVRRLIEQAYISPAKQAFKLLVVSFKTITIEAEQALLKITEEPPVTTKFVFIVEGHLNFLPTLQSRFCNLESLSVGDSSSNFSDFLSLPMVDKLSTIGKKLDSKDSLWLQTFKKDLGQWLQANLTKLSVSDRESCYFVFSRLNTRGASNKMLLEELVLTLEASTKKL